MTEGIPTPELVRTAAGPSGTTLAVFKVRGQGYFGLSSNSGEYSEGPYETVGEARRAAHRLAERLLKGDKLDRLCALRKKGMAALKEGREHDAMHLAAQVLRLHERMMKGAR